MALPDIGARAWGVVVVTASSSWDEGGSDGTEPAAREPGGRMLCFGERVRHLRSEGTAEAGVGEHAHQIGGRRRLYGMLEHEREALRGLHPGGAEGVPFGLAPQRPPRGHAGGGRQ